MNCLTHFEIYGDEPYGLANFYAKVFGWEVEQMPGIGYSRINTGSAEAERLNGGLSYRALPDLQSRSKRSWRKNWLDRRSNQPDKRRKDSRE